MKSKHTKERNKYIVGLCLGIVISLLIVLSHKYWSDVYQNENVHIIIKYLLISSYLFSILCSYQLIYYWRCSPHRYWRDLASPHTHDQNTRKTISKLKKYDLLELELSFNEIKSSLDIYHMENRIRNIISLTKKSQQKYNPILDIIQKK